MDIVKLGISPLSDYHLKLHFELRGFEGCFPLILMGLGHSSYSDDITGAFYDFW